LSTFGVDDDFHSAGQTNARGAAHSGGVSECLDVRAPQDDWLTCFVGESGGSGGEVIGQTREVQDDSRGEVFQQGE
jgi:hypothetical protein